MRRWMKGLLLSLAALLAFSAAAQQRQPEYRLGSGDVIRIVVFQNPDLTVEKAVKEAEAGAGAPITVTGFVRLAVGEGIDKGGPEDFAGEVAKMVSG